ncbi:MAG: hypothetical protein CMH64_03480 [Nanoarchaeota archaeon]|nr:hypothetical protein [Nanoarchaeota archaeon]|tara:strand:- start:552 stop:2462 length:1911 start_codon:yes stop_codon:yes gene_type:complete
MQKKLLLFLMIFVLIYSVNASEEADWLADRGTSGNWGTMIETAFSIMALDKEAGYGDLVVNGSRFLIDQLESCMESNSCNIKDTAIAVWALSEVGGNAIIVRDAGTWLLNSRSNVFTGELPSTNNQWFVQIVSTVAGVCTLTNTDTGANVFVDVNLSDGYVPWYEITADSEILTETTEDLNLDCTSLGRNSILSLINKKPDANGVDNFYIKQEEHNVKNVSISLGLACWGPNYRGGGCDSQEGRETTAYVLFALEKAGKTGDPSWLTQQTDLGLLENLFLYKVTDDAQYLTTLTNEKNSQGYWGNADLFATSILYGQLKPNTIVNGVDNWVASRRHPQGCWEVPLCSIEQTAVVLQSGSFQTAVQGCADQDGDSKCDDVDEDIDGDRLLNDLDPFPRNPDVNGNGVPDGEEDLDGDGFANYEDSDIDGDGVANERDRDPFDEAVGGPDRDPGGEVTVGAICNTSEGCLGSRNAIGECVDTPGDDCPRGDIDDCNVGGFCVTRDNCSGTYSSSCQCIADADCNTSGSGSGGGDTNTRDRGDGDEGSSVVLWSLLVLLLLIALGGGGFLAYKKGLLKFKFGKKKAPEAKYTPKLLPKNPGNYVPRMAQRAAAKIPKAAKGIEKDLDQSMEELEKLLGK